MHYITVYKNLSKKVSINSRILTLYSILFKSIVESKIKSIVEKVA